MLRRTVLAAIVPLVLALGLLTAPPSTAQSIPVSNSIGIVKLPNQVRKGNCARYLLRWNFNPPTNEWTVLARIRTPRGFSIASQFWDSNSKNPDGTPNKLGRTEGRLRIPLCGSSVRPGRYKVQMQMIYSDGRDNYTVNRHPTYFRLLRHR